MSITSKELIGRSSGIILQKEGFAIMKAIEAQGTKDNFNHGNLFQPKESTFEKLKIQNELAFDQLWELIDFGIVTQVFELKYSETIGTMELIPYVVSLPDGFASMEEAFHSLLLKTINNIKKYVSDKKVFTEEIWRSVLIRISDPEYLQNFGGSDDLETWLNVSKFPFLPSSVMLKEARDFLLETLDKEPKLLVLPKVGIYSITDLQANLFLSIAYELFLAKVEPFVLHFDMALCDRIDELNQDVKNNSTVDLQNEAALIKKRMEVYLSYESLLKERGYFLYVSVISKLCNIAEKVKDASKRTELDRLLRVYLTLLESTVDFDSRLLRINLEKDDNHDLIIIEQLRRNPNVISAEWQEEDSKIAIFALNNISNLIEINKIIYENYRFTTEYILYFKALIEQNEPDIKAIFNDEEFVKTYGRNLQSVYFNYIPWFYKFFYFLGVTSIVNTGYSKAKSILTYGQMDRKFQYNKRRENYYKRKLREREERIEKETKQLHKRILIQAIEEAFFERKTLPTVEWIQNNYPIFTLEIIEKLIPDFAFLKIPNRAVSDQTIICYPISSEFESRIKKLKDLLNQWIRGEDDIQEAIKSRATEIRSYLQDKNDQT